MSRRTNMQDRQGCSLSHLIFRRRHSTQASFRRWPDLSEDGPGSGVGWLSDSEAALREPPTSGLLRDILQGFLCDEEVLVFFLGFPGRHPLPATTPV
jgi:hypothetical protein